MRTSSRRHTCRLVTGVVAFSSPVSAQQVSSTATGQTNADHRRMSAGQVRGVSPALEQLTQQRLYGEVWKRPGMSPRNRWRMTVAALNADGKAEWLSYHLNHGVHLGITPAQVSEVSTQRAFCTGWPSTFAALPVIRRVLAERTAAGHGPPFSEKGK